MEKFIVKGGQKLHGEVTVQGSKNAVLPIIAAAILNKGKTIINNCPRLTDVDVALKILNKLGCKTKWNGNQLEIFDTNIVTTEIPEDLAVEMRSSVIFAGALLGRCNIAQVCYPGGCEIGPRPIDLHLKGFTKLGCTVSEIENGSVKIETDKLKGAKITLEYPSVGATENIMLAASGCEEETIIVNAAKEPEICDLAKYLKSLGVSIRGEGTSQIHIKGLTDINKEVIHTVIPDRIVAGSYLIAAAITQGRIVLHNANAEDFSALVGILEETGCEIKAYKNTILLAANRKLKGIGPIRTMPYPGFPTDLQAPVMALLSIAEGTSMIIETVFENRFKHVNELGRMGADILVDGRTAVIKGTKRLKGANVVASDLRGGAALLIAGLRAEGITIVNNIHHIDRGYERVENVIASLGGDIQRVKM